MYFPSFVGALCSSLFCYALLCVHSSFSIILKRERKQVTLLLLSNRCIVTINALWLFLRVPWAGLQCVSVVFPDHTHLLFTEYLNNYIKGNLLKLKESFFLVCQGTKYDFKQSILSYCVCYPIIVIEGTDQCYRALFSESVMSQL